MSSARQSKPGSFLLSHSVTAYFLLAFTISWLGALAVAAPHLLRHEPLPKIAGILMFPVMLLGPSLSGMVLTGLTAGKAGLRDLVFPSVAGGNSSALVCPAVHSPGSRSNSSIHAKNISFPGLHSQPFSNGSLLRRPRRAFGRNRLDWIWVSQNVFAAQSAWSQHLARTALGLMALAGRQLPRNSHAPRSVLVPIFPGLHFRYGRHARSHLLALHQYKKRANRSAHAHKLYRLPGSFQPSRRVSQARSDVVRILWRRVMDRRSHRGKKIRHTPGTLIALLRRLPEHFKCH
jgi:hypothetical protein